MATKQVRWRCAADHPGVLAPTRLGLEDVRRICWPCSLAAGKVVRRTSSVLEAKAERLRAKSARKAKTKRASVRRSREAAKERQREREVIAGIDVARELERLWAHAFRLRTLTRTTMPALTVSRSETFAGERGASGLAFWGSEWRIHLTVGHECSRVRLCGVLAHEVAHLMTPGEHHSGVFWAVLAELVAAAYGTAPAQDLGGSKWVKQLTIEDSMRACTWLRDGLAPPRKPAAPRLAGKAKVLSVRAA